MSEMVNPQDQLAVILTKDQLLFIIDKLLKSTIIGEQVLFFHGIINALQKPVKIEQPTAPETQPEVSGE